MVSDITALVEVALGWVLFVTFCQRNKGLFAVWSLLSCIVYTTNSQPSAPLNKWMMESKVTG